MPYLVLGSQFSGPPLAYWLLLLPVRRILCYSFFCVDNNIGRFPGSLTQTFPGLACLPEFNFIYSNLQNKQSIFQQSVFSGFFPFCVSVFMAFWVIWQPVLPYSSSLAPDTRTSVIFAFPLAAPHFILFVYLFIKSIHGPLNMTN